jgi:hypothetical protein
MTTTIKVNAFNVKPNGTFKHFGDETGTTQFYVVSDTLKKYLGEDNIWVSWDYNNWYFIINQSGQPDEGCDNTYDYIQIIKSIWEPFVYPPGIFEDYKNDHLAFEIIYDE